VPERLRRFDPRNPWQTLLITLLTLIVLAWFVWVLAMWPESVVFVRGLER
jgi:hypothetical protein